MATSCHDRTWLEEQYSASRWSKKFGADEIIVNFLNVCQTASAQARTSDRVELDIAYGPSVSERLDVFHPSNPPSDGSCSAVPVLIFIHGGFWQEMDKSDHSFIGRAFSERGVICVVVGYELAPRATLYEIVDQTRRAVDFTLQRFPSSPIYVGGHSAGAHLSTMTALSTGNLSRNITGLILISGVYELTPIVNTYINDAIKLDMNSAAELSPIHSVDSITAKKVLVLVGGDESPEFRRQSNEIHIELRNNSIQSELIVVPDEDHFSIISNLNDASFSAFKKILQFIQG